MILSDKHVFILEDDITNLAIITAILRRHGATVYYDVWGASTLAQMKATPKIDIILLDLMLKRTNISGYTIYDQIRGDARLASIPVVLVTAADPDTELTVAKNKGFNGFIGKPIDRTTFGEQIAEVLAGKEVWVTA
jgi:CheY-like chemotaxis protein